MNDEVWLPIPGYEEWYDVSNLGRVRSWKSPYRGGPGRTLDKIGHRRRAEPKLMKPWVGEGRGRDRPAVALAHPHRRFYVHQLVMLAFVGPCPDGYEVCHFDGDVANNQLENLRYDTRKANHADKLRHGTQLRGEQVPNHRLTRDQVLTIRSRRTAGETLESIGRDYGIDQGTIGRIARRERWAWL